MKILALPLIVGVFAGSSIADVFPERLPSRSRTLARLSAVLEQPVAGNWKGASFRSLCRRLSSQHEISIIIDRRIDPDQSAEIATGDRTLRSAIDEIARTANASVTQLANCLVIAPPSAASRLRTLIAIRESEIPSAAAGGSLAVSRLKTEKKTVGWNDLDEPADIAVAVARQFGLTISGAEKIPHELWVGAIIPEATAAEALSIILNQFDLTFEWANRGLGVRLLPIPATIAIARTYVLHGRAGEEILRTLRSRIEGLDAGVRNGNLVVRGTIEEHEIVAAALGRSRKSSRTPMKTKASALPLERQSYSLQVRNARLRDLLDELKDRGIPLRFDAASLQKAGIDLNRKVSLDLNNLPARQFFNELFDPLGLKFHFDQAPVGVEPK